MSCESKEMRPLLSSLRMACGQENGSPALEAALAEYVDRLRGEVRSIPAPEEISRALEHICDWLYDHNLNVDHVLQAVGGTPPSFRTAFRWHVGIPPRQFIEANRLFVARDIIETLDVPCHVVAYRVGYAHYRTFARAYRRFFDEPPRGSSAIVSGGDGVVASEPSLTHGTPVEATMLYHQPSSESERSGRTARACQEPCAAQNWIP